MTRSHRFIGLLSPSVTSGSTAMGATCILLATQAWAYIAHKQLFYDVLFGSFGIKTNVLTTSDIFANFRTTVLSNTTVYQIILVGSAVIVGLMVYALISGTSKLIHDSSLLASEMKSHDTRDKATVHETVVRLATRMAAGIGWALYTILFLNVIYPLCLVLLQNSLDALSDSVANPLGWIYGILSVILLAIAFHIHITFLRLILLRYRVFGTYGYD